MFKQIFTKTQSILEILSLIFRNYGQFAKFFVICIYTLEFVLDPKNPFEKSRCFVPKIGLYGLTKEKLGIKIMAL